jgi:hypothetical protein
MAFSSAVIVAAKSSRGGSKLLCVSLTNVIESMF